MWSKNINMGCNRYCTK